MILMQLRLLSVSSLEVSEQNLTGESVPVAKTTKPFGAEGANMPIGDRTNVCYSSTVVTKGRGTGITIGTGMNTQVRKYDLICHIIEAHLGLDWTYCKNYK